MAMTTVRTIKKVKRVGHEHLIFKSRKENLKTFLVWRRFWSRGLAFNYIDGGIVVNKVKGLVLSYFNSTGNISYYICLILILVLFFMGERDMKR